MVGALGVAVLMLLGGAATPAFGAAKPHVRLSLNEAPGGCALEVRTRRVRSWTQIVLQRRVDLGWEDVTRGYARTGASTRRFGCVIADGVAVRAVLVRRGKQLAASRSVRRVAPVFRPPVVPPAVAPPVLVPAPAAAAPVPPSDPVVAPSDIPPPDRTAPDTVITEGPEGLVASTRAGFAYASDGAPDLAGFECSLDGAAFATCPAGGLALENVGDGDHALEVRALDTAGNADPTPARRVWGVDTTAPQTTIVEAPPARSASRTGRVTFTSDDPGATFACAVDGGEPSPCPAHGLELTGLTHGAHTVSVRGTDALGNADPTPAEHAFVVDVRPPDTTVTEGPPALSAQRTVTVRYAGSPTADATRFECRRDGGDFEPCPDAVSDVGDLDDGTHTYEVRAVDALGNTDPSPARVTWETDTVAPETIIEAGPDATTASRTASLEYASPDPDDVAHMQCAVDGGAFRACTRGGLNLRGLIDGDHSVAVRAVDPVGNVDVTPATWAWTVDGPDDVDPEGTASGIAEVFPTMLRDAVPSGDVDPHIKKVTQGSGFPLAGGVEGTIGATLADGVSVTADGTTIGVKPAGSSTVTGVVKDNAVLYDDAGGRDVAIRPTGDGGTEILSVLPGDATSTSYDLQIPAGARLVDLPNGDVAVVEPGAEPLADMSQAVAEMDEAESDVIAAAVESATDSQQAATAFEQVEDAAGTLADTPDLTEPPAPDPALLADAAGEIPAYADATATDAQAAAAVEELESTIDPADITPEDRAAIATAEEDFAEAQAIVEDLEGAEKQAIEAAASTAFTDEMHAILAEQAMENAETAVDADLAIGDVEAEQARTALLAVAAQREVDDGRVVGLISAPMTKAENGAPIASSLEVTGPATVTLSIPPELDGDAVADPFFVPVVAFVARAAVQHVAKTVIKKAAQKAVHVVDDAASAALRASKAIPKTVARAGNAAKNAAQVAARAAGRVVTQVRASAALNAARNASARIVAQQAEARRIAAERIRQMQAQAKKVWDEAREAGRRAREEVLRKRDELAESIRVIDHKRVMDAVQGVIRAGGQARQAAAAVRDRLTQVLRGRLAQIRKSEVVDVAKRVAKEALVEELENWIDELNGTDNAFVDHCLPILVKWQVTRKMPVPHERSVAGTADTLDLGECFTELGREQDSPVDASVLSPYPTQDELREILELSFAEAERAGEAALAQFTAAPANAPARQAAVVSSIIPAGVASQRIGYVQIAAINQGKSLPLATTHLYVPGGFPWIHAGHVPGRGDRVVLTDENSDGLWSYGEVVNAVIEVRPPLMRSISPWVSYGFVSDDVEFSGGHGFHLHVNGPLEPLRVYNQVTNGPLHMREDYVPVRLTTMPWTYCGRRGCNIGGTERWTDWWYHHAVCRTYGERTTNGEDHHSRDDGNPALYSSNEYYGVQEGGTFGYVSWVWIHPDDRGGLGLPWC